MEHDYNDPEIKRLNMTAHVDKKQFKDTSFQVTPAVRITSYGSTHNFGNYQNPKNNSNSMIGNDDVKTVVGNVIEISIDSVISN
jgi:hypothetical protein